MSVGPEGGVKVPPSELVRRMIAQGYAMPIQCSIAAGHITYEFLGGVYDGVKMRLYPPFERSLTFGDQVYDWGAPKNGRSKRLTYRAREE